MTGEERKPHHIYTASYSRPCGCPLGYDHHVNNPAYREYLKAKGTGE